MKTISVVKLTAGDKADLHPLDDALEATIRSIVM